MNKWISSQLTQFHLDIKALSIYNLVCRNYAPITQVSSEKQTLMVSASLSHTFSISRYLPSLQSSLSIFSEYLCITSAPIIPVFPIKRRKERRNSASTGSKEFRERGTVNCSIRHGIDIRIYYRIEFQGTLEGWQGRKLKRIRRIRFTSVARTEIRKPEQWLPRAWESILDVQFQTQYYSRCESLRCSLHYERLSYSQSRPGPAGRVFRERSTGSCEQRNSPGITDS